MLFEGETVEDEISLSNGTIAVTSHRVLALVQRDDTQRFEHADLPNVDDVRTQTRGTFRYLNWGIRGGVIGVLMLGGGVLLQTNPMFQQMFETLEDVQSTGSVAGVGEMIGTIMTFLSMLNVALVFVGLIATMGALGLVGLYLNSRQRELVIDVVERDPIRIPVEDEQEEAHATSRLKGTL
jgi:hypothetical protein